MHSQLEVPAKLQQSFRKLSGSFWESFHEVREGLQPASSSLRATCDALWADRSNRCPGSASSQKVLPFFPARARGPRALSLRGCARARRPQGAGGGGVAWAVVRSWAPVGVSLGMGSPALEPLSKRTWVFSFLSLSLSSSGSWKTSISILFSHVLSCFVLSCLVLPSPLPVWLELFSCL